MSTKRILITLLLVGLAELSVLAAGVFTGQSQPVGGPPFHLHAADIAFVAVAALLLAAAAYTPVRLLLRLRRRTRDDYSPAGKS
jgi:hypothetical protein